ncbi:MAG: hypothetical protein ABR878_06395 [Roseiarcus sp.]
MTVTLDLFSRQVVGFATRRQARDEAVDWLRFYSRRRPRSTLAFERKGVGDKEKLAA